MISLWDVLKASKGLPVSDLYAAMWGRKMAVKYTVTELEGTLPMSIVSADKPLMDYRIYGNTEQTGTPTPDNPIMPSGCGERTENVMPAGERKTVDSKGVTFSSDGNGRYHISGTAAAKASARFNLLQAFTTPISVSKGGQGTLSFFNTQSNINVCFIFYNGATKVDDWRQYLIGRTETNYNLIGNKYIDSVEITVESGETVDMTITPEFTDDGILPSIYEPYGYKLPILSNSTVTNIYLGESQTTRRIKKLVLTGEEVWAKGTYAFNSTLSGVQAYAPVLCTHYQYFDGASSQAPTNSISTQSGGGTSIWIKTPNHNDTTIEQWKSYLAQQYAAGTPVTVWYVLAEPEIGIVNEPLMKIGDYADTVSMEQAGVSIPTAAGATVIDYDGTPKPSQMYIKYLEVKK